MQSSPSDYYRYWAKARPGDGREASCHLLPYHNLDVAAVGWHLLSPQRPLSVELAQRLAIPANQLRQCLVFMLGLHDIGKFARSFQGLAQPPGANLVPPVPRYEYTVRHDQLGAMVWAENWAGWLRDGVLAMAADVQDRGTRKGLKQTLPIFAEPIFGHHGQPVASSAALPLSAYFASDEAADDIQATGAFIADWSAVIAPDWPVQRFTDPEFQQTLRALSWTIAGWAVLSDWLGSNQAYFGYCDQPVPLQEYWQETALPQARSVLADTGMDDSPRPVAYTGLSDWFDSDDIVPTPLQNRAEEQALGNGPQMFILEDVTGAGKTEAACILAQRLLAAGQGDGLFFALPTMATSNAMYARLGQLHSRFFDVDSNPSFVLAHGARQLNDDFAASLGFQQPSDQDYADDEPSASTQYNRWLADSRKKALLADVGVGTIDQVLMGVLPFKHQSLRLYGMARKILVIDEVHAYDIYMQTLLERVLAHHARQGGSVIMLTATLPQRMRRALVAAWQDGGGMPPEQPQQTDFPLFTHVTDDGVDEVPVATRQAVARSVAIDWIDDESKAVEQALDAVDRGECVVWVRNTVDDAIRVFENIQSHHPDPDRCLLFHSRFTMADRQRLEAAVISRFGKESAPADRAGQVLIATQVFQESLDCDADTMISDLAPIDLLIQRAGRLQRHDRGQRRQPRLTVLAPDWTDAPDKDWLRRPLPGTQAVYRDTALCWLTQRVLRDNNRICMPDDARRLVESVYGEQAEDDLPDGLQETHFENEGEQRGNVAMAGFNALELTDGYCYDNYQWQDEQDVGTRLTDEPTRQVVLLRRSEGSGLTLWLDPSIRHAAMLSQVRLRQSQTEKLTPLSSVDEPAWTALQEQFKGLRFATPWVVGDDQCCDYSETLGVRFTKNTQQVADTESVALDDIKGEI